MATASRIRNKHLTCSICFEFYTVPKTLPCMHSFCETCLENHIQAKAKDGENGFGCPMCNTFATIPDPNLPSHQWAGLFRTDFKLTGMLEELQMIEQEGKMSRDVTQLPKLIEGLRNQEQRLIEKIDDDRVTLTRISQEQEEITQQISDVFSTLRLKLQRKEESLKQRFQQLCAQRKDSTSRSWLTKQKLVDQVNKLIEEAEDIFATRSSGDTSERMKKIQDGHKQFNAGFGCVQTIMLSNLELNMKQEDIMKFDALVFCEVTREQGNVMGDQISNTDPPSVREGPPAVAPKPSVPKPPAPPPPPPQPTSVIINTSTTSGTNSSTVPGSPATNPSSIHGSSATNLSIVPGSSSGTNNPQRISQTSSKARAPPVPSVKPELMAILTPSKEDQDKEPDFQDIVVLRDGQSQIVVIADYNNRKVIALYIQQGTKTQRTLKLDSHPSRLCALDSSKVVVSCSDPYKIQFIKVSPELKQLGSFKPPINNTSITVLNQGTLAIAAKNKVNVITTAGSLMREFKIKSESSFYSMSWYMTTTPTGSIIVSDRYGEMISCVTPTGQTLWQWMTPDSTPPAGVACDQQGRIYVVLTGKKQICRLSETGKYLGVVLGDTDDLVLPTAMEIDQFGQWYVMKQSKQIQVFKP